MIESGLNIQTPFEQAVSEDIVRGREVLNMTGAFELTVGFHKIVYVCAIYGPGNITVSDLDLTYSIAIEESTIFKFPIKVFPEGLINVEASENTLTQLLIIDEY